MSTYSDLKIELIVTGDQLNTWGATTNTNLGTALEEAIVGRATLTLANPPANPTDISLVNTNSSQIGRNYILNVVSAGTLSTTANIQVSAIDKPFLVENNTTGGQAILIKTSGGAGVTIPAGFKTLVYSYNDGISDDVVYGIDYLSSPTIASPTLSRPLTNGGKVVVSALGTLTTGTTTINLATAQVYTATITAANTIVFAFSNAPAAGESQIVLLRLTNGGSGTIIWPAGTKFSYGLAPNLTVSGVDMLGIYYDVTTTTYMVFVVGTDMS
jgi:hypothetical protein